MGAGGGAFGVSQLVPRGRGCAMQSFMDQTLVADFEREKRKNSKSKKDPLIG